MTGVVQFPIARIIQTGVDQYIKHMERVYENRPFISRLNRHILDNLLPLIPEHVKEDLKQVSSGSREAAYIPENMLRDLIMERGQGGVNEVVYYTATGYVLSRMQEHQGAYKTLKLALVADTVLHGYNMQENLEDLYRRQRVTNDDHLKEVITTAENNANKTIARLCLQVQDEFDRSPDVV